MTPAVDRDQTEHIWRQYLAVISRLSKVSIEPGDLLEQSPYDPFRRVYAANGSVQKIVLLSHSNPTDVRAQNLAGEFAVLRKLDGVQGVPVPVNYFSSAGVEMLRLKRVEGKPLNQIQAGWGRMALVWAQASWIILRVAWRGISHNDISEENLLVSEDRQVTLIDFDQATRARFPAAILRGFLGISVGPGAMRSCLRWTFGQYRRRRKAGVG